MDNLSLGWFILLDFILPELGPVELLLIKFAVVVTLVLLLSCLLFYPTIKKLISEVKLHYHQVLDRIKSYGVMFFLPVIILVTFTLVIKIYLAIYTPIHYDEAFTYLHFTSEGFLRSATFYPAPNNHVLHSLLTNISYYLPFSETFNLRLPVILISSITSFLLFYCFTRLTTGKIAFIITLIFSFLNPVIYYGYNSRGYYLVLLFFLISFYAIIQIIRNREEPLEQKHYFVVFTCSSILGFYTMPSFLYPFLSLESFLFFTSLLTNSKKLLHYLFYSILLTGLGVALLYGPIIIVSGIESLTNSNSVVPVPRSEVLSDLSSHFASTYEYLFSLNFKFIYLFLIFLIIYLLFKKIRPLEVILCFYIIIFCPLIIILHSLIPFPRTWIFIIIPVLYLLSLFLQGIENFYKIERVVFSGAILISFMHLHIFWDTIRTRETFSYEAEKLSAYLMNYDPKNIYIENDLIDINLAYLFLTKGENVRIFENDPLLKRDYDFLIIGKKTETFSNYKYVKEFGKDIHVYQKVR